MNAQELDQTAWATDSNVLTLLCCLLDPKSLAVSRAVCKAWKAAATDPQVRRAVFVHNWSLLGCHGQPRQLHFYETAAVTSFVHEHTVRASDTLQMLAVRHRVSVPCLKRINNLMSDHSLHSRTHLYIPVTSEQDLQGQVVCFKFCSTIKRDFAVVLSAPPPGDHQGQQQEAWGHQQQQQAGAERQRATASACKVDVLQARLCHMLGRSLYIDEATAQFYLQDAGGDLKAAMEAFAQDVAWEGTTAGPIRTAPVQRWIKGEMGI